MTEAILLIVEILFVLTTSDTPPELSANGLRIPAHSRFNFIEHGPGLDATFLARLLSSARANVLPHQVCSFIRDLFHDLRGLVQRCFRQVLNPHPEHTQVDRKSTRLNSSH